MSAATTNLAGKATRREWIGLAVIALPCMLYAMDLTVLNLAVPHLTAELRPSASELLWIVDIYGFMVAGSLITMGSLGDRIGRRRLLLTGAAVFGIASIIAAFSTSVGMLIATRALLGIAGATLAPSTLSLIRTMFEDEDERRFAIGIWISSFSTGGAIGPLIGGLLLEHFWWGSVFLASVPVMLLLLALGPSLLPEYRNPDAGRIDLPSAAQSVVAVLSIIYAVKHASEHGPGWLSATALGVGLAAGALFIGRQKRLADSFIDLSLFRSRAFCAALIINVSGFFFMFGAFLFIAQYLQLVAGLSPLQAGLWTLPSALAFIAGSMSVPMLAGLASRSAIMAGGLLTAAIGFALLTQLGVGSSLWIVVAGTVLFSLGFTPVVAMTTDLIVSAAPPERAGAAAALSETSAELGGALGIALLGSIMTAVYRSGMENVASDTLSPTALEALRSTLGGGLGALTDLPRAVAMPLIDAARQAFVHGMRIDVSIAAAALLLIAIFARLSLRGSDSIASDAH